MLTKTIRAFLGTGKSFGSSGGNAEMSRRRLQDARSDVIDGAEKSLGRSRVRIH